MHEDCIILLDQKGAAPQPFNPFRAFRVFEDFGYRILSMNASRPGCDSNQMKIVVSEHDVEPISAFIYEVEHLERLRSSIDDVPDEHDARLGGNILEQSSQAFHAPLNVAYGKILTHVFFFHH